jgi:hypothetical protein
MENASIAEFLAAVTWIGEKGVAARHLQLLIGEPFSRFGFSERTHVMLLQLALKQGVVTAVELQQHLREQELWARMHGRSILIDTETLPSVALIDAYLGLTEGIPS